jgi:hypothetical protein
MTANATLNQTPARRGTAAAAGFCPASAGVFYSLRGGGFIVRNRDSGGDGAAVSPRFHRLEFEFEMASAFCRARNELKNNPN